GLRHGGTPGLADAFFPARRRLAISPAFAEELAFHAHVHLLNSRASPIGARRTGSRLPLPHFARLRQKRGRGQSLSRPSRNCRAGSDRLMTYLRAPVAQLDRALPSEGRGREFESRRARQLVLVCEHRGWPFWLARTAFSSKSLFPLIRT